MHRKTAFFSPGAGLAASIGNASLFIGSDIASPPARDLLDLFQKSAVSAPDGVRREGVFSGLPHRIGVFARPGDPIQVAYDPGNPDRHEPDIFGMDALSPRRRRSGQAGERGNQRPPAGGGGGGP